MIALTKLTSQHERERQNRAQSENVVLQASASHPMIQRLEAMVEMYDQEGITARANQGGPVRWTHPRETTGCLFPRSSLQAGRKCTGEPVLSQVVGEQWFMSVAPMRVQAPFPPRESRGVLPR